jgi:Tfp pilus assembly protein PilN
MTRINLLPPEILEKRKSEKQLIYIIAAFIGLILFLIAVYSFGAIQIKKEEQRLAELKAENQRLNKAIAEYQVYEKRKAELQKMQNIISTALSGEIAWHKILNEISMVIPSDVWLQDFTGDDLEGITCKGYTADYDFDTPDLGHKPVAEWLVRMSEIKVLASIWLNYSQKTKFKEQPAIEFGVAAQLKGKKPASAPTAPPANK